MAALQLIEAAKARRAALGLFLEWMVPAPEEPSGERYFSAYPADAASRARMLAAAERKGWRLIEPAKAPQ